MEKIELYIKKQHELNLEINTRLDLANRILANIKKTNEFSDDKLRSSCMAEYQIGPIWRQCDRYRANYPSSKESSQSVNNNLLENCNYNF